MLVDLKDIIHHDPSSFHFDATGGLEGKKENLKIKKTITTKDTKNTKEKVFRQDDRMKARV